MKEVVFCKDCTLYGTVPPGEPAICGNCGSCDTEVYVEKLQPAGCHVCGGRLVEIRGRHPKDDRRKVCPTCLASRIDQIQEIADPSYGRAYTNFPGDDKKA